MKRRKQKDATAGPPKPPVSSKDTSKAGGSRTSAPPPPPPPPADVDDGDDEEKTAAFVIEGGLPFGQLPPAPPPSAPVLPAPPPMSVVIAEDDDEEKTAFFLGDSAPPPLPPPPSGASVSLAATIVEEEDDEEKTAFFVGADGPPPIPAPSGAGLTAPAAATPAETADDDEEKTAFFLGDAAPAGPAPPAATAPATEAADDDEDKTAFFLGDAAPAGSPPVPGPASSQPSDAATIVEDDDEDKTSFLAADAPPGPTTPPPTVPTPPATAATDDGDATVMFSGDGPAPAKPAPSDPDLSEQTSNTESTGSTSAFTGSTGSTGFSAWGSGGATGGTGGTSPTTTPTTVTGGVPQAGATIAQYELIRKLGEGGMGAVFLARDIRLGRRVAIKFLHATNPELTERFVIEARATARVEHENIIPIYEVGEWGGSPYMVLQFLQGSELTKVIPRGKGMPIPRVVEIMTPVLRALDCAHREGIVHRDLKPDNIFITDSGVTKVLDFGIAKVVQGDDKTSDGEGPVSAADLAAAGSNTNLTRHGSIMGTMPYMSPEQWGNGVSIDHTTDIWAVGIMMYKMLSGKHPLHPLKGTELMVTGFLDEPMPSLKEKAPDLPKEIIEIIDKALEKDKSKRWPDALSFLRALEPFQPGRYNVSRTISVEESPYAGLSAFQEKDAAKFFGRNREIAAMTQRLRDCPMMAVVGSSGTGKSSFVRAGVVPALKNSGESWDIHVVRPGRAPLMALSALLTQITNEGGAGTTTSMNIGEEIEQQQKRAERLAAEPGYLGTVLRRHARRQKKKLMLFVDQFEELYTLVEDADERLAFTSCLSAAADDPTSPMRVVVSIRSDFLDRCVEDVHFMTELSQGLFFMTAPTRDGMRDSLVLPAEMAGYKFESESIVNDMLDHLAHTNGALPLLQFTADKLWSERDPSRKMLTQAAYDSLGGVSGALAVHADQVLAQITGEHLKLARGLMLRLVTPDRTRAIVTMDDLLQLGPKAEVQRLIDQLVAARLLVVQTGGGATGATVELVHESLIHRWPQLKRWLDEGQDDAAFLEQLRTAARQWASKGRDSGLLWRGEMVEEAKRFVRRYRGELPEVEQHFLKAVFALATRAQRIKRALLVAASIVVSLLLTAAAVALYIINESSQEAERQAVAARAAEVRAKDAAEEAEARKVQAEEAKIQAEAALAEAEESNKLREIAREAERKALQEANMSREQLAEALIDAQAAEKRAVAAAEDARRARGTAEERAREAIAARQQALAANNNLQVALKEVEAGRRRAVEALKIAEERLKGSVATTLE